MWMAMNLGDLFKSSKIPSPALTVISGVIQILSKNKWDALYISLISGNVAIGKLNNLSEPTKSSFLFLNASNLINNSSKILYLIT